MLDTLKAVLAFMTPKERLRYYTFLALRALVSLLDLAGILAIGFLATSMAVSLTEGSNPERTIELAGIRVIAVSAASLPVFSFAILLLFVVKAVLSVLLTRGLAQFLARIEARSAKAITQNVFGSDLEVARSKTKEEVLFAVQAGSPGAFNGLLNSIGIVFAESFLFILVILAFAFVNPAIALGAIVYFGLIGFLIQVFIGRLMQRAGEQISKATIQANSGISDLGEVIRESTILGRRGFFFDRIYKSRMDAAGNFADQFVLSGMPRYIVETALIIAIAVFALLQSLSGDIGSSAATLAIFLTGGLRLTASLLPLQSAFLAIKQSVPMATTALELLKGPTLDATESNDTIHYQSESEPVSVTLENINFSFAGNAEPTLRNVSLNIKAGTQAAIIGLSGAGKSTLADLILGLLTPSSGQILIDNTSPKDIVLSRPGLLGYVPQKPGMVSGTIEENIALGLSPEEVNRKALNQAVTDAHLGPLVGTLSNGLNTDLGKRNDELSGGQLQRIGLARALYSQPKLLVMDEATSALDAESENEINTALDEMRGKVTVILIAHRLNTIQRSDVVYLMEEGRLTASGTFQDLLRKNKTVKNLANLMAIDSPEER